MQHKSLQDASFTVFFWKLLWQFHWTNTERGIYFSWDMFCFATWRGVPPGGRGWINCLEQRYCYVVFKTREHNWSNSSLAIEKLVLDFQHQFYKKKTSSVQRHKWSLTTNDPKTKNDLQSGLQMIPDVDRKWSRRKIRNCMDVGFLGIFNDFFSLFMYFH